MRAATMSARPTNTGRLIDEPAELVAIGLEVLDRTTGDAAFHRRFRDRRRDVGDEPRIERARNEVVGAERRRRFAIRLRDELRRLRLRESGQRAHGGELHLFVDRARAAVERAAKDEGKAQRIVDLVRIVGAAGSDQAIGPRFFCDLRPNLRLGIRHRENDRLVRHLRDHLGGQHAARGQSEEYVGAVDDLVERARLCFLRVARLVWIHRFDAPLVDDALAVGHPDVPRGQAETHLKVETCERSRAGA